MPAVGAGPPPWLPPDGPAREAWDRLAPVLTATRVLTVADADALALGCMALRDYLAALDDPTGWRRADSAWKRALTALSSFGLTPSSRPKVSALPVAEVDPLDAWMASYQGSPPPPPRTRRAKPPAEPSDDLEAWEDS
jgi:phage terminase small subunit